MAKTAPHRSASPDLDAIVVGAGPNGLAAGITLAQAGCSVLLIEARGTVGGACRSAELTLPGYLHDTCSAIYPLTVGSPFFRDQPFEKYGLRWVHQPIALAHPLDDGSAAVLSRDWDETGASFDRPEDARAWRRLFEPVASSWWRLADAALAPLRLPIPRHPFLMARFGLTGLRSATSVASRFRGTRARALFAGIAGHSFVPLEHIPTASFGLILGGSGHAVGWPQPEGGAQRIVDAMAAMFQEAGGQIRTGWTIKSLHELPAARMVLLDLTPAQLLRLGGTRWPARYRRQLARYRYGPGVFKIDWALDGPIPWTAEACRRAGTIHLGGTLEEIAAAERRSWSGVQPEKPFVLLGQPTLFETGRAPEGAHIAWAYCHVPHGSTADRTAAIEEQVERFAPGFRKLIRARRTMDAAAMEAYDPNLVGGDINGGAALLSQLFTRPVVRYVPYATPDPQVFLCSSSTPPSGGVHGLCGYYAARAALRRHGSAPVRSVARSWSQTEEAEEGGRP